MPPRGRLSGTLDDRLSSRRPPVLCRGEKGCRNSPSPDLSEFAHLNYRHRLTLRSVRPWSRFRAGRRGSPARDRPHPLEESPLAGVIDAPVDRDGLVAGREGLALEAVVEIAPRGVLTEGRSEVVPRLLEVEVVVLVEQDRLRCIGRIRSHVAHHPGDPV